MATEQAAAPSHKKSFKLRFASRREPGRSHVSAVKPLGLPEVVRGSAAGAVDTGAEARALLRVRALFAAGPRDKFSAPVTTSHEYGWWASAQGPREPRLQHGIRDSAWLKERLRVLAAGLGRR